MGVGRKQSWICAELRQVHSVCHRRNGMPFGLLFTAQPQAPAFMLAGASGWAVNEGSGWTRGGFRF